MNHFSSFQLVEVINKKTPFCTQLITPYEWHPNALNTSFRSVLGLVQHVLWALAEHFNKLHWVFRMKPWKFCLYVKTRCSGRLDGTGNLVPHCTCPCPHGMVEIKALLSMGRGAADGRNLHKRWKNQPRAVFSGGSFRGYSSCRRQSLKGKRIHCVCLP